MQDLLVDEADSGDLERRLVGDIRGSFLVPDFQRGYRWTELEVRQLLDDIRESDGATYYLQPVVVKRRREDSWELIDGQQRLTTLYLLFHYLRRAHIPTAEAGYSITYATRPGTKSYLEELTEADADRNIDFFHLYGAYRCIEAWFDGFDHRATHEAMRIYQCLFEGVEVLWYEAPEETDSTELFTRLNVGRIPLNDAELAKALLLSRSREAPGQTDRAPEIAANWDGFETDLRSPELWAFVTGEAESQPTHLSLLLDTLAGGPEDRKREPFRTFETLRHEIMADPERFWNEIVDLHSLVQGWYDDSDLFHKVGYVIATGSSFPELVELSEGMGRSGFASSLDDEIRDRLNLSATDLVDLSFDNGTKAADVLLLMNTETLRKARDSTERYSFKAHADRLWSLEHIHAQNAEKLNTAEQWRVWLESHQEALHDLPGMDEGHRKDLLDRIGAALSGAVNKQVFTALEHEVTAAFVSDVELGDDDLHSIANLALLDHRDNAALNNSVFEVKRRHIIRRDRRGSYIPVCTRNVFLKYYTELGQQQLHFWSMADREAYLAAIEDAVGPYLRAEEEGPAA